MKQIIVHVTVDASVDLLKSMYYLIVSVKEILKKIHKYLQCLLFVFLFLPILFILFTVAA